MNRSKNNFYLLQVLLLFLLWVAPSIIMAQDLSNKTFQVGYDLRQGAYFGFDHHYKNYSLGADIGTSLGITEPWQYVSITMDNNYHFGNLNRYNIKEWLVNLRLIWANNFEGESNKPNAFFLTPGIGKDYFFNENNGLHLGIGLNILLTSRDKTNVSLPDGEFYEYDQDLSFSIRLQYFF